MRAQSVIIRPTIRWDHEAVVDDTGIVIKRADYDPFGKIRTGDPLTGLLNLKKVKAKKGSK